MKEIEEKFVPRLLSNDQLVEVCTELREALADDPNFLPKILTGDETCCMVMIQKLNSHHHSGRLPEKARQVQSNVESALMYIFLIFKALCTREKINTFMGVCITFQGFINIFFVRDLNILVNFV